MTKKMTAFEFTETPSYDESQITIDLSREKLEIGEIFSNTFESSAVKKSTWIKLFNSKFGNNIRLTVSLAVSIHIGAYHIRQVIYT